MIGLGEKVDNALYIIDSVLDQYSEVAVACSFGKDSMVTLHLARRINPKVKVFCVTTPFKHPETIEYRDRMIKEWDLPITIYSQPDDIFAANTELWKHDPDACCDYFKVQPTKRAVASLEAWICGLRRTEGPSREFYTYVETKSGLVKANPILDFTEVDIWLYHAIHQIPPNPLYAQGYRSLGCAPCTAPCSESERSGRWLGTSKEGGECGIHTRILK